MACVFCIFSFPGGMLCRCIGGVQTGEDFTAIIIGNVHGGWSESILLKNGLPTVFNEEKLLKFKIENNIITLPFYIEPNQNILSADIEIEYDVDVFDFVNTNKTILSESFQVFQNNEKGNLRVGMYSVNPLNVGGKLVNLVFKTKDAKKNKSTFHLKKYRLNDDVVMNVD